MLVFLSALLAWRSWSLLTRDDLEIAETGGWHGSPRHAVSGRRYGMVRIPRSKADTPTRSDVAVGWFLGSVPRLGGFQVERRCGLLAAGVAAVPLWGFVTTSSDPATEFGDGVLLVCRSSRLRRCWHPVAFSGQVGTAPAARTLLGTHVVLWRTPDGQLRSALDRCPHRWAQLSKGTVTNGRLVCPYHGWQFGPDGCGGRGPAAGGGGVAAPVGVPAGAAHGRGARHGLDLPGAAAVWLRSRPSPSSKTPGFDRIEVGVIRYHASAAAIIDNNTDSTHVAFVHSGSFGADQDPRVPVGSVQRSSFGISISYERDAGRPHSHFAATGAPGTR